MVEGRIMEFIVILRGREAGVDPSLWLKTECCSWTDLSLALFRTNFLETMTSHTSLVRLWYLRVGGGRAG